MMETERAPETSVTFNELIRLIATIEELLE
jgi:hypothetical protein